VEKDYLTLKRASASRPSGEWSEDDFDVLVEGVVVGRIRHCITGRDALDVDPRLRAPQRSQAHPRLCGNT
jgi:hypothetical protein